MQLTVVLLALILGGDFFTGSVLASALAKLVLRYTEVSNDQRKANAIKAEVGLPCLRENSD